MRKGIAVMSVLGLLGVLYGCATGAGEPIYPQDSGAEQVTSVSKFDAISENASAYQGKEMKFAGAITRITETDDGYLVLAKWLPYPKKLALDQGPQDLPSVPKREYLLRFKGKRTKEFYTTQGNKFLAEAYVDGTQKAATSILAIEKPVLHVTIKCVYVWETGTSNLAQSPDNEYPDVRARTLCADK